MFPMYDMREIGTAVTPYGPVHVLVGRYPRGGAVSVQLMAAGSIPEPMGVLSVNLHPQGVRVGHDEFCVKDWSENESLIPPLLACGLFQRTGRLVPTGFVLSPVWRIKDPAHVPPLSRCDQQLAAKGGRA